MPKDLTHYQNEGISPGSAITTNTNAQLQNQAFGDTGGAFNTYGVKVDGWIMHQEMTVAANGNETPTSATPVDLTYTFRKSCTSNCKKFWIYLGNAFEND